LINKYLAALQRTCNNPTALGDGAVGYIAAEHSERLGINEVLQWQASTRCYNGRHRRCFYGHPKLKGF